MTNRGEGSTTNQMLTAPPDAIFIWNNEFPAYAKELAEHLKRSDLKIETPNALSDVGVVELIGQDRDVILDHALKITPEMQRNLYSLKTPGRKVTQAVIAPSDLIPEKLFADVIPWAITGTGLIIRNAAYKVAARLRYTPTPINGDYTISREGSMQLMQRLADLISQHNSETAGRDAQPSQALTEEPDRDAALKIVVNLLSDPKTPKAIKKKFSDQLVPHL